MGALNSLKKFVMDVMLNKKNSTIAARMGALISCTVVCVRLSMLKG